MVQLMMKAKVEDAELELKWSKERFSLKISKVLRRWGHHQDVVAAFKTIINREAVRVWEQATSSTSAPRNHRRPRPIASTFRAAGPERCAHAL